MHLYQPAQFESLLFDLGIDISHSRHCIPDNLICFPSPEWLHETFIARWNFYHKTLPAYSPNAFNCNDFVRECAAFAVREHARTAKHPLAGLAFGEYWQQGTPGHAVNIAIPYSSGSFWLWFFEPQTDSVLGKPDLNLCDYVRF